MRYQSATSFGELALLYNSPRRATIARECGGQQAIDRAVFNMIMVASNKHIIDRKYEYLKKAEFCSCLDDESVLATLCEEVRQAHAAHRRQRASERARGRVFGRISGDGRTALPSCNCQRSPHCRPSQTRLALNPLTGDL